MGYLDYAIVVIYLTAIVVTGVTLQKKAVDLTDNAQAKESLSKALRRYESATVE